MHLVYDWDVRPNDEMCRQEILRQVEKAQIGNGGGFEPTSFGSMKILFRDYGSLSQTAQNDEMLNHRQAGRIILGGAVVAARTGLKLSSKVN